jgi:predicted lipoprotein with Yx(FWY)xxD motif
MTRTRAKSLTFLAGVALLGLISLDVTACGGGASASKAPPKTDDGRAATVGAANSELGKILVDSRGRTLYLFEKDAGTNSACAGPCASAWPPLRVTGKPTVGGGTNGALVGTTTRSDGKPQVTYYGHPLYRYQGDQKPGDTNGQGLTAFGGGWFAISPAGGQVSGGPSSSGGGSGY